MADKDKPSGKRSSRPRPAEAGAARPPRPPKGPRTRQGGNGVPAPKGPSASKGSPSVAPRLATEQATRARGWLQGMKKYLKSVRSEFGRITWPTKQELRAATIVVIATLVVVTFYLWVVDKLIAQIFMRLGG